MNAALLTRLIEAGTPAALVAEVALELGRAEAERGALDRRRHADADRKRAQREREAAARDASRDIAGQDVTDRDGADAPPSLDKKTPQTPIRINPSPQAPNEANASSEPQTQIGFEKPKRGKAAARQPSDRKRRGARIPDDWRPPALGELPPMAQALAAQWPAGAYDGQGELFAAYWRGEGGRQGSRKLDWTQTWCNWIGRVTGQVLRDAKAGVRFSIAAPAAVPHQRTAIEVERDDALRQRVEELQAAEGDAAKAIRDTIRRDVGARTYDNWIRPCALDASAAGIVVTSHTRFMSDWLADHFNDRFAAVGAAVLGRPVPVRFCLGQLAETRRAA